MSFAIIENLSYRFNIYFDFPQDIIRNVQFIKLWKKWIQTSSEKMIGIQPMLEVFFLYINTNSTCRPFYSFSIEFFIVYLHFAYCNWLFGWTKKNQAISKGESQYSWHQGLITITKQIMNMRRNKKNKKKLSHRLSV